MLSSTALKAVNSTSLRHFLCPPQSLFHVSAGGLAGSSQNAVFARRIGLYCSIAVCAVCRKSVFSFPVLVLCCDKAIRFPWNSCCASSPVLMNNVRAFAVVNYDLYVPDVNICPGKKAGHGAPSSIAVWIWTCLFRQGNLHRPSPKHMTSSVTTVNPKSNW